MTRGMQDDLEKFVNKHKNEFDDLTPKDSIWQNIRTELDIAPINVNNLVIWKAAAIILFLFSLGLTLFVNRDYLAYSPETVAMYDDEFMSTEAYYTSEINERQKLIKAVAHSLPEIGKDFEQDWSLLDRSYKNLKKDYRHDKSEEIRNALVQNLRTRMSLLNKQIEVLEQIEQKRVSILEI